jgi:hypothetical protein
MIAASYYIQIGLGLGEELTGAGNRQSSDLRAAEFSFPTLSRSTNIYECPKSLQGIHTLQIWSEYGWEILSTA